MNNPFRPLAPNATVQLRVWPRGWPFKGKARAESFRVEYFGVPADLVTAGVATTQMVAAGKRGTARVDGDGHRFSRVVHADGRITLTRKDLPREKAALLPGVAEELRRCFLDPGFAEDMEQISAVHIGPLLERFRRRPAVGGAA